METASLFAGKALVVFGHALNTCILDYVCGAPFSLMASSSNACAASQSATYTIHVNALPVVTANATANTVCAGTSVTLTGGGATSYVWTSGVTDAVAFIPPSTATYTVTGTDGNNCSNTATKTINVNALPVVSINGLAPSYCYNA